MPPALLVLALAGAALAAGAWVVIRAVRNAGDGFEDEVGFHPGAEPPGPLAPPGSSRTEAPAG